MGIIKAGDPGFLTAVRGDGRRVDQGLLAAAAGGDRSPSASPTGVPPEVLDVRASRPAAGDPGMGAPPPPVAWRIDDAAVGYAEAVAAMEARVAAIREGAASELVWLLEHPPLYTAGTSARPADLLDPGRFPVYRSGRGGQYTYHGPGQRVGYVMLDLQRRRPDLRRFVHDLEEWLIRALARFQVRGERREGRVGIWVAAGCGERKIAAIGVRVRRWVTFHGVALNVDPDLAHFDGVVPCGLAGYGVTSLAALGLPVGMPEVDLALREAWEEVFGSAGQASGR